jgi:uncharacterized protein (TIGR00255 family)
MKSMTGYGRAAQALGQWEVVVQASSVNRKALEVTLSLPRDWQAIEPELTAKARERASRGRIHLAVDVQMAGGSSVAPWDEAAIRETLSRLEGIAMERQIPFQPSAELIYQIATARGRGEGTALPLEQATPVVLAAAERALDEMAAMRACEGEALARDFRERLAKLRSLISSVTERSPQAVSAYREGLLTRLRQAGLELDLNDERVLKEIAIFADRCDISEELTRLASHLEQFNQLVGSTESVGRKIEFLLQEISREVHTIGSKANDLDIARSVIELKNELERIREQAANVE